MMKTGEFTFSSSVKKSTTPYSQGNEVDETFLSVNISNKKKKVIGGAKIAAIED